MILRYFLKSAAVTALLSGTISPALAAPEDFINVIGGTSTVKDRNAPEAIPLARDAQSVLGARFFYEKISPSVMATAGAARTAFDQQCRKDGGSVIPDSDPAARDFGVRFAKVFAGETPYKNRQASFVAVCTTDPSHVVGVMGAIVYDPSELLTNSSDGGSKMMFGLFQPKVRTAIYAFRPGLVTPPAVLAAAAQRALDQQAKSATEAAARALAEQNEIALYQKGLKVGALTSCGLVIEIRGSIAQVERVERAGVIGATVWFPITQLRPRRYDCN